MSKPVHFATLSSISSHRKVRENQLIMLYSAGFSFVYQNIFTVEYKTKEHPSEDTVGVRARGALSIYLKGENSETKSSVRNLARIRSGRNNPWYKLMEVAKLGLESAKMRGYA